MYLQHRRTFHGDTTDVFDRKAIGRTPVQVAPVVPSTLGPTPTPHSSMSNAAAVAMTSALNRAQPIAGKHLCLFSTLIVNLILISFSLDCSWL